MTESYPRLSARTQRFTLGEPRNVVVSGDGRRIVFLRSPSGTDPRTCLWTLDAASGDERLIADPVQLVAGDEELGSLPPAERARRERLREGAGGITSFATDDDFTSAVFMLAGRLYLTDLDTGRCREVDVDGPVFDPRLNPAGDRIAFVSGSRLMVTELDGTGVVLAGADEPATVSWGMAEFVAAEEIGRLRGYWWSPAGDRIAATRVDVAPVGTWYVADPGDPSRPPVTMPYPAAGTPNAEVTLHLISLAGDDVIDVEWDRSALEYLTAVEWSEHGLDIAVQSRDQRRVEVRTVDVATGATELAWADTDPHWVELAPGVPRRGPGGELVTVADRDGARRLMVDDEPVTPADLQVRSVSRIDDHGTLFVANPIDDATVTHVWRRTPDGDLVALTDEPGVHSAVGGGPTTVIRSTTLDEPGATWTTSAGVSIGSVPMTPPIEARPMISMVGAKRLATALLLPADHDGSPLPVLLDPYGGPHAGRVVRTHNAHLGSQWFADQGFAVVVTDGRGTPGRGSAWERAVAGDLATGVLDDQIEALHELAATHPELDTARVAIRGWSFGGYLAALAVLARPDVFHAAVAGAPVTEWRLYDTHYTERYLGDPATSAGDYHRSSLLPLAPALSRPLLLIHGLADDNVVAAHTLQLSSTLLAHGRPHEVLPLVGVSHMTPQEQVAENLLLHQLDFLRRALGSGGSTLPAGPTPTATVHGDG